MRKYLFGLALIGAFSLGMPLAAQAASYPQTGKTTCSAAESYFGLGAPTSVNDSAGFQTIAYVGRSPWSVSSGSGMDWSADAASTTAFDLFCNGAGVYIGASDVR